jgi:hypothetical protein
MGAILTKKNMSVVASFIIVGVLGVFYFFMPKPDVPDHLCIHLKKELNMVCPDVLASTTLLHPGSIVDYSAARETAEGAKAPIPAADLLNDVCRVPVT